MNFLAGPFERPVGGPVLNQSLVALSGIFWPLCKQLFKLESCFQYVQTCSDLFKSTLQSPKWHLAILAASVWPPIRFHTLSAPHSGVQFAWLDIWILQIPEEAYVIHTMYGLRGLHFCSLSLKRLLIITVCC